MIEPGKVARSRVMLSLLAAVAFGVSTAHAQGTGILRGIVRDKESGEPLQFANVSILGTERGAATESDGTFAVYYIPPGSYTVLATYIGYDPSRLAGVAIEANRTTEIVAELTPSVAATIDEVTVFGDKPLVDVRNTSSVKNITAKDIENLTIEPTLESIIGQQAGVTVQDGNIHFRGGRADETLLLVDGVELKDVTGGDALTDAVSAGSLSEMTIAKGGWDAKYGQAISGVIDAKLKEGTVRFHGRFGYVTDELLGSENLDQLNFQLEGPNPVLAPVALVLGLDKAQPATFHLDVSSELSDTYLPSIKDLAYPARLETGYRGSFLGKEYEYGTFFRQRGDNNWRLTFKTGWNLHPRHKISATYVKAIGFSGLFQAHDIGDVNRNITAYPWTWSRRLDHHYTVAEDLYLVSLQWKQTLSSEMYHRFLLKNRFNAVHRDVAGKLWYEYVPAKQGEEEALDALGLGHPYFTDAGDATDYRDRYTDLYGFDWELVRKTEHHDFSVGLNGDYENVQYFSMNASNITSDNPLGDEYDLFHVYPASGSIFVQDQIEYPGINLKVGLRTDVFFPGEQVERLYEQAARPGFNADTRAEFLDKTHGIFGRRYKIRWSPRLAVSHPISDRSHMFFNYGRFTQWPTYFYMYAKTGALSSQEFPNIGNPNLDPQVSAQYEFGVGHKFSERASFRATIFYKDIYDYPTSERTDLGTRTTRRQSFFIYRNLDYARSRGFEIEIEKRREKHVGFSASYSYSVASGKSSDPNSLKIVQSLGGDARETSLEEEFMWWNRPHKLTLSVSYQVDSDQVPPRLFGWRLPRDWKASVFWMLQTGEAYSPETPSGERTGKDYSRNAPTDAVLDGDLSKSFRLGRTRFNLTLQGRNLTNHRTVLDVDPSTGFPWRAGVGQHWGDNDNPRTLVRNEWLARETNAEASAFVEDNKAVIRTITDTANPAYVSAPRTIRLGLSYEW